MATVDPVTAGHAAVRTAPAAARPARYGQQNGYGRADFRGVPQETESKAVVALALAIASFVVVPLIPAIAALIVGLAARRSIAASHGRLSGDGLVTAAKVIASRNIALAVFVVAIVVLLGVAASTEAFKDMSGAPEEPYPA